MLLVLVVLAVVVLVVSAPLRRGRAEAVEAAESAQRAELEAAKEAKYREIRDAELDYRTGKLSEEDWRAQDRALRAEAIEILRRLDASGEPTGYPGRPHVHGALRRPGLHRRRPDLPDAPALGEGRGHVGRLRRRHGGGGTGGSLMERNLDRWTIIFAVLFVLNTFALLKI